VANLKVEDLLKEFHRLGIEFVVIGRMAAVAQGSAYLTLDLDLCYSRKTENLQKLAHALAPFQPLLRGVSPDLPFRLDASALKSGLNFTLTTDLGDLDLLGEVAALGAYAPSCGLPLIIVKDHFLATRHTAWAAPGVRFLDWICVPTMVQ
jgi:hypothetical protein